MLTYAKPRITAIFFLLALLVYLAIRLIALERFPIYFFSDEAVQAVRAADFIRDGLRSESGELLPAFFKNSYQYNLGTSVYLQILPTLLFGKHVFVTRAISVLISLLTALAAGLTFELIFQRRAGWLAILLLSLMPAWFLHSRTAFETVLAVSFYSAFWFCYASYRERDPRFLYPAVLFAALAFYSYSPAQVVVSLTVIAFFLNDVRYHRQQRPIVLRAFFLGLFLLIPYARFVWLHPGEIQNHLQIVGSPWMSDLSGLQKITHVGWEYVRAFNPGYWFLPNTIDLPRHVMKGYGHLWLPSLPLIALGLVECLWHLRSSRHRLILIALLCAPAGAAFAQLGITRTLFFIFPAALLATLGATSLWQWLTLRKPFERLQSRTYRLVLLMVLFSTLSVANITMLVDALAHGPTWFHDYGLYGMQFGAKEVFLQIKADLASDPQTQIVLTPAWANGTDILARYFFPDPLPFSLASIDSYIREYKPLEEGTILIMMPNERDDMLASGKFINIRTEKILPYPDGSPGFYFVRLDYIKGIEELFAQEQAVRRQLVSTDLNLQDGSRVALHYSTLDMGSILDLFDDDPLSVVRTWESNPFTLQFDFSQPRPAHQLMLRVGGEPTRIELDLYIDMDNPPQLITLTVPENPHPRYVTVDLNLTQPLIKAVVRVYNENEQEPAHVHLWEIRFLPDLE